MNPGEIVGNIWDFHERGLWIVVPTNGDINQYNRAVMGRGIALQCAQRYPEVPLQLAVLLSKYGNVPFMIVGHKILTFPVKHHYYQDADINLIRKSATALRYTVDTYTGHEIKKIIIPHVGCGNGRLNWVVVHPILDEILDDRFTVISNGK